MTDYRADCIAGIDFGTSKIALVLVDPWKKSILFIASEPHGSDLCLPDSSLKEQSVDVTMEAFKRLLEKLAGQLAEKRAGTPAGHPTGDRFNLRSIGLTGQMHGILGIDRAGKAVTNLVTWQDGRGNAPMKDGKTLLRLMEARGGRRRIATGYGIVTLFDWMHHGRHPDLAGFCTIPDYAGMLLTGKKEPAMDPSMAESTGAFDIESGSWDEKYLSVLGIDRGLFPPVLPSRTVIGNARDSQWLRGKIFSGKAFPRKGDVPVSVPIGDNQASFVGSVKDFTSSLLLNIGTGSQISFAVKSRAEVRSVAEIDGYDVTLRPFVDGGVLVAGSALSGGVVYSVLRDFFAEVGQGLFGLEPGESLYRRMEELAGEKNDAGGLRVYPLFAGKRSDPSARGCIDGIGLLNLTPQNLIYGTLEGEVRILREMLSEEALGRMDSLVGSGNGIRRNALLVRIVSRVFGRKLHIPVHEEEAALGAAIHGAVAAGVYRDYGEAREIITYREESER